MQEAIIYKNDARIKNAWLQISTGCLNIQKETLSFENACYEFFYAIKEFHSRLKLDPGADGYHSCVQQLSENFPITVNLTQATKLRQIGQSFLNYTLNAHKYAHTKRHNSILNNPNQEHLTSHELIVWFVPMSRYINQLLATIKVIDGADDFFSQPIEDRDISLEYPQKMIDRSEDYFFEAAFYLLHQLSKLVGTQETSENEKVLIKKIMAEAKEILFEREKSPRRRFEELAIFLAKHDTKDNDNLHKIIAKFISFIPPGLNTYSKIPKDLRSKYLQYHFQKNTTSPDAQYMIASKIPTQPKAGNILSENALTKKIIDLPHLARANKILANTSEDNFINMTIRLIHNLCLYVLKYPEANLLHDRQHIVNIILKKANTLLFQRRTRSAERLKELAQCLSEQDVQYKGELHNIIKNAYSDIPGLEEFAQREIPIQKRALFVRLKLIMHQDYYLLSESESSTLSDLEINQKLSQIPSLVRAHLEEHYEQPIPHVWKFCNWFSAIFAHNPIRKKIVDQGLGGELAQLTAKL